jgi:LCP family protein required for cell wall assembly
MPEGSITPARRGSNPRRIFLAVTAGVAALVTLLSAFGMGAYVWVNRQRTTLTIHTLEPAPGEGPAGVPDILGRCARRACNYLLLGSDSREGLSPEEQEAFGTDEDIGGANRSDTIILVHTQPSQQQALFLSFPRDLWVDIPGVGMGRINSAFEGGVEGNGPARVARTVKALTGMQIHHVLYVSLAGFQGLIDALNGVDLCIPYPMKDELTGLDIGAGCQRLDGATALAFVRTRHQPCDRVPDFARIGRQQQFLRAVISALLSPGRLVELPTLVPRLLDNLVVDEGLNVADLAYLAGTLEDVGTGNADFRSVPTTPVGIYDGSGRYLSVVQPIEPDAGELFERIRSGEPLGDLGTELAQTPPSPATIVTAVYDRGGGTVAAEVFDILTEGGFNTSPGLLPGSAVELPRKGPMILFREEAEAMGKVVGTYFGNMQLVPAPPRLLPDGVDVAVVVTARYNLPEPPADDAPVECPT